MDIQKIAGQIIRLGDRTIANPRVSKRSLCTVRKKDNTEETLTELYMTPAADERLKNAKRDNKVTTLYYIPIQIKKKMVRNMLFAIATEEEGNKTRLYSGDIEIGPERATLLRMGKMNLWTFRLMIAMGVTLTIGGFYTFLITLPIGLAFMFFGYKALQETKQNLQRYKEMPSDEDLEAYLDKEFPWRVAKRAAQRTQAAA